MPKRRMLLLTEGHFGVYSSKTAVSIIRYCRDEVAGVLDSKVAGRRIEEMIGFGEGVPIFATLKEALSVKPTEIVVGVAPVGGGLEGVWRERVKEALLAGISVISGLHVMIGEDAELSAIAARTGARIYDFRKSPENLPIAGMKAMETKAFRVLMIGTDCCSGKMVTALELTAAARAAGLDARFLATGQTGIMIAGKGIAIDHTVSDFTAGAAEKLVLDDGDADVVFVEGQGSLIHPGYSGVTLSLMHGTLPQAMVLCHVHKRRFVQGFPRDVKLPALPEMIELSERAMKPIFPSKVVGISLNTLGLSDADARKAVDKAAAATGLPATDVIRFGVAPLFNAVREVMNEASH